MHAHVPLRQKSGSTAPVIQVLEESFLRKLLHRSFESLPEFRKNLLGANFGHDRPTRDFHKLTDKAIEIPTQPSHSPLLLSRQPMGKKWSKYRLRKNNSGAYLSHELKLLHHLSEMILGSKGVDFPSYKVHEMHPRKNRILGIMFAPIRQVRKDNLQKSGGFRQALKWIKLKIYVTILSRA